MILEISEGGISEFPGGPEIRGSGEISGEIPGNPGNSGNSGISGVSGGTPQNGHFGPKSGISGGPGGVRGGPGFVRGIASLGFPTHKPGGSGGGPGGPGSGGSRACNPCMDFGPFSGCWGPFNKCIFRSGFGVFFCARGCARGWSARVCFPGPGIWDSDPGVSELIHSNESCMFVP